MTLFLRPRFTRFALRFFVAILGSPLARFLLASLKQFYLPSDPPKHSTLLDVPRQNFLGEMIPVFSPIPPSAAPPSTPTVIPCSGLSLWEAISPRLLNEGKSPRPSPRFSPDQKGFEPSHAGDVIGTNGFTDLCVHLSEHKPVKSFVPITLRRDRAFPSKTSSRVTEMSPRAVRSAVIPFIRA
jgi:hypothetical protein